MIYGQEVLEQSRVEKLLVEMMNGVGKFMVEKSRVKNENLGLESSWLKSLGLKSQGVENWC